MNRRPVTNLPASIHQLLLNKARQTHRPFNEVLQYYAMERFLYRLSRSPYADRFILKGALMFRIWDLESYRPTMDIDLSGRTANDVENLVAIFKEVSSQQVEPDGLIFNPESVRGVRIAEEANYAGARIRLQVNLGAARVSVQLDIGFGDVIVPPPELVEYPTILDFPPPRLKGYNKESVVAEKFESMVALGILNSRMKDYFDIWTLCRRFDFDGHTVSQAIAKTFSNRHTEIDPNPVGLSVRFSEDPAKAAQWRGFVRKGGLQNSPDLKTVVTSIAGFLIPVATALVKKNDLRGNWHAPGPWIIPSAEP